MSFNHIRGHEKIVAILARILETRRLAQAYLFSGPDGIGKYCTALAFVKGLLCSAPGAASCGECATCVQVATGNHPDLHIIRPEEGLISIERIRTMQQELSRKSFAGSYKACIIDEAEKMNTAAQNSLLKTLEEPTPDTVILLTTGKPYLLLPTVRSRCQHLVFQPLTIPVAADLIRAREHSDEPTALLLASVTGGSPGKALELDPQYVARLRERWIEFIMQFQGRDLFLLAEEFCLDREAVELKLNVVRTWLWDIVLYKIYGTFDHLVNQDRGKEIAHQSALWSLKNLLDILFRIEEYIGSLDHNVNPQLTVEALFLRMTPGKEARVGE